MIYTFPETFRGLRGQLVENMFLSGMLLSNAGVLERCSCVGPQVSFEPLTKRGSLLPFLELGFKPLHVSKAV